VASRVTANRIFFLLSAGPTSSDCCLPSMYLTSKQRNVVKRLLRWLILLAPQTFILLRPRSFLYCPRNLFAEQYRRTKSTGNTICFVNLLLCSIKVCVEQYLLSHGRHGAVHRPLRQDALLNHKRNRVGR